MKKMKDWEQESWLSAVDASYLKKIFECYDNHHSLQSNGFEALGTDALKEFYHKEKPSDIARLAMAPLLTPAADSEAKNLHQILEDYRSQGYLHAHFNPLSHSKSRTFLHKASDLSGVGVNALPESKRFGQSSVSAWLTTLETFYCQPIGLEIAHADKAKRDWGYELYEQIAQQQLSTEQLHHLFERLVAAEGLEKALASKFPGAKRFSLEGLDSFIILLEEILRKSAKDGGIKEVTLGLSHRGRLNVMVNTLGKSPAELFKEFSGQHQFHGDYSGDVKYHQGFSSCLSFDGHDIHMALSFNPSHLEVIGSVIHGSTRARKDKLHGESKKQVMAIVVHGDAAISGQGVVMEMLNMSQTPDFGIGGCIHIILNNQIGFTTSKPEEARSTRYCTDIAKMLGAPVIHVNADDPVAVYKAAVFAAHWRVQWAEDVFIDLVGYRRQGHNEADEPAVTQPLMYKDIAKKPSALSVFGQYLASNNLLSVDEQNAKKSQYRDKLESGQIVAPFYKEAILPRFFDWSSYIGKSLRPGSVATGVSLNQLKELGATLILQTKGMSLHPRLEKIFALREKMYAGELELDWGAAELLAYASLLNEGYSLRLSGQDCQRGTFFHRHAVVNDSITAESKNILAVFAQHGKKCAVVNSLLSEMAVMGFEYGYAITDPETFVLWEAQFGDFANGAQIVIDQFLCSGEKKWQRLCGLTLLLPHGYEGQGPEHSSARIERFLQLAAQNNMRICYPSTPAQIFHLLRSQMRAHHRHPLVIFTPKSLLRLPEASSPLSLFAQGRFEEVLYPSNYKKAVKKILLCSGKIYYELQQHIKKNALSDVLIVRLEQLYPFPAEALQKIFTEYQLVHDIRWVQEEPQNQGAWFFIRPLVEKLTGRELPYIGRQEQAAPAVGSAAQHELQQATILRAAFA